MDLRQIENIITIEQEQSISRAAEKLFLTQSALNQQLLKLERELGTPLFERRKHSMIPTLAGRIYLNTAKQMISMKQDKMCIRDSARIISSKFLSSHLITFISLLLLLILPNCFLISTLISL